MVNNHYRWDFIGLSTDEKPTPETSEKVVNGSTFYTSDDSKLYVWCDGEWYEKIVSGGGGGGGDINVVQTTGTSTTDVMSQNAVTSALQNIPSGGAVQLTSSDYNYPTDNPSGVALWRLSPGLYNWDNGVKVYTSASSSNTNGASAFVTEAAGNAREFVEVLKFYPSGGNNTYTWSKVNYNTGGIVSNIDSAHLLSDKSVVNSLTSTSTTAPLSANQGKVLNAKIVGVTLTTTIRPQHWSALADSSPYNYQHTAIVPGVSNDSSLELINDNPVLFAKHGFAIAGVTLSSSMANVTIYSIGLPDDTVALNITIRG